jgi:hypothetical protein
MSPELGRGETSIWEHCSPQQVRENVSGAVAELGTRVPVMDALAAVALTVRADW